jgi:tetratricopeptide (TPR) repeat protein
VTRVRQTSRAATWLLALGLAVVGAVTLVACGGDPSEPREQALDTRLEAHAVLAGKPSAEGLAYVQAIAEAHRKADETADPQARLAHLLGALERPTPAGDGTAELLHVELLARTAELILETGHAERALELLEPRLATSRSLPIDRASARCLVALGDAAAQTGDHALAMGSYARALEMLSLLLEEVEP